MRRHGGPDAGGPLDRLQRLAREEHTGGFAAALQASCHGAPRTGAPVHGGDRGEVREPGHAAGRRGRAAAARLPDGRRGLQGHVPRGREPEHRHHGRERLRQDRDHQDRHAGAAAGSLPAPTLHSHMQAGPMPGSSQLPRMQWGQPADLRICASARIVMPMRESQVQPSCRLVGSIGMGWPSRAA